VAIETLSFEYNIALPSSGATSLLIGIMPAGAVLGVLASIQSIHRFRRVTGIYIATLVNVVAIIMVNMNNFPLLVAGRFIEGVCIGVYAYIAPIYLREIAPKEMRRMLGLFFSLGKIIGVLFVIVLELILRKTGVGVSYRIILSLTAVFALIQSTLLLCFGFNTPTEMI
jgi:MFS transporter, SP family, galactose:H+ symporter